MADYSHTKSYKDKIYPVNCLESSNLFKRVEPLLTPDLMVSRYLLGIPNVPTFTNDQLKDRINLAANDFELESNLTITREQFIERQPFDRALYRSFVYTKVNHKPINSVEKFAIVSSNGENIFNMPPDWLEVGFAHRGQLNLIPILSVFGASGLQNGQPTNAGLVFIQAISNFYWMPAFYEVTYTSGLADAKGNIPVVVNEVIGMIAAIEILGILQARFPYSSQSLSQDGISQSSALKNGGNIYKDRIDELTTKKDKMLNKIKGIFNNKLFVSNI